MTAAAPDLLDLLDAISTGPESWRIAERERVIAAMEVAHDVDGHIDPGRVRRLLTNDAGCLDVNSRVLAATFGSLAKRGVIKHAGWTTNTDRRGRNAGKPQHLWEWVQA